MSADFEASITRRLQALNHTQGSIEKTSKTLLKNKHMAKEIVKLWFKEFRQASEKQKLAFLHLANDVIQNGKAGQQAPQFASFFEPVLIPAFRETASIPSDAIRSAVAHLLIVWANRSVYTRTFLRNLRATCQRAANQADRAIQGRNPTKKNPFDFCFTSALINASAFNAQSRFSSSATPSGQQQQQHQPQQVWIDENNFTSPPVGGFASVGDQFTPEMPGARPNFSAFREELRRELQSDAVKPPETSELIQQIEALQSAPSGDATTRQAIAQFPSEVADPQEALQMVTTAATEHGDEQASLLERELVERIEGALNRLDAYNKQLEEEMTQRSQLGISLHAYRSALADSIQQTRNCIEDVQAKAEHARDLQTSLEGHIVSLPDICMRHDQTASDQLNPLPNIVDLFS